MRKEETRRAVGMLGGRVQDIRFLDFENERLVERKADAKERIVSVLGEVSPSEVYVPSPFEGHAEHILTHEIARAACAETGGCPSIFEFIVSFKRGTGIDAVPRRVVKVDVASCLCRAV